MAKFLMTKQKFMNQWLRHFAPNLTKKQYKEHVKDQFIWHVFSWRLIECDELLVGDDARRAFDLSNKNDCICCDLYNGSGVTNKCPTKYNKADNIDESLTEFYVVSKDWSWTYVKTHEGNLCGPYFLKVQS